MVKVKLKIAAHYVQPLAQLLSGWAQSAPFLGNLEVAAVVAGEVAAKLLPKTLFGGDVSLKLSFSEALAVHELLMHKAEASNLVRYILGQIDQFVKTQRGLRETACWEIEANAQKALNSWN